MLETMEMIINRKADTTESLAHLVRSITVLPLAREYLKKNPETLVKSPRFLNTISESFAQHHRLYQRLGE